MKTFRRFFFLACLSAMAAAARPDDRPITFAVAEVETLPQAQWYKPLPGVWYAHGLSFEGEERGVIIGNYLATAIALLIIEPYEEVGLDTTVAVRTEQGWILLRKIKMKT
jgi:hypothetical protein